ncbi:ATP-binding protein [Streptomyces sp. NPDC046831]|uniref:ATP-binding protein n=1 Tax=Streptomyces sp. NPDC046831 TaxID=3154805 RepID=UPI0033D3E987
MVLTPRKQASDERITDRRATALRYGATYGAGAAPIADARRAVHVLLDRAARAFGTRVSTRTEQEAQLVVSELVTNAVRHAPGPCGLVLAADGERLSITVRDTSPALPRVHERCGSRVGGHGLHLVRSCSRALRVTGLPGGKEITAEVAL